MGQASTQPAPVQPETLQPDTENDDRIPPFESVRRKLKELERNAHGLWQVLKAVVSTDHPMLAHIIPMRRCNLACTYCNEFDDFSKPVSARRDAAAHRQTGRAGHVGGHHQRRRAAAASRARRHDRAHSQARHDLRPDHQRIPADGRAHPAAEPRRPGVAADLHRQRESRTRSRRRV